MSNNKLGIVVVAYKNIVGVKRLLSSLLNAEYYNEEVTLIISIDHSDDDAVSNYASSFIWPFGRIIVVNHSTNLGLKQHILKCGDYMEEYQLDAIAVFEDDIVVSPSFYNYMRQAVNFYFEDDCVAGISLYKHEKNINAKSPFVPLKTEFDSFFLQYAQSWGQVWLKKQWADFRKWLDYEEYKTINLKKVPDNIKKWNRSWLKYHIMYCIACNKYFAYPYDSMATNFTDVGVHNKFTNTDFQVPLFFGNDTIFRFPSINQALAKYDAFFENESIASLCNSIPQNTIIDLYGQKKNSLPSSGYCLSSANLNKHIVSSWGLQMRPLELNIIYNVPGDYFHLYDLSKDAKNKTKRKRVFNKIEYELKGTNIFSSSFISYYFQTLLQKIKGKIKR